MVWLNSGYNKGNIKTFRKERDRKMRDIPGIQVQLVELNVCWLRFKERSTCRCTLLLSKPSLLWFVDGKV